MATRDPQAAGPTTGAEDSARFTADEKRVVHFTGFAHAATHYVELTYPTLAVALAAESGLPLQDLLGLSLAGYVLFGLGALPAGVAADRFGSRPVILAGLFLAGASACAASLVAPGWPLALCLAGLGIGASFYHPAGMGLLSRAVRARGRALGINGIYGNAGIALAPLVTASLATQLGWRLTFAITGGAIVSATAAFALVRIPDAPPLPLPADPSGTASGSSRWTIIAFVVLCATATLGGFAYRGNTVAQPALFAESIDFMNYGYAASAVMLVGIVGQYLGGVIADRSRLAIAYLAFHTASLPLVILISMTSGAPLMAVSALYVFFALGMQPVENSLFAALTPDRWRSTAYGLKFVLTFGIGASAVAMVRWVAADRGWAGVYQVLSGTVLVLVLGILALLAALARRRKLGELTPGL